MDVLKRSEFCGVRFVKDIKQGTVFTGIVGAYTKSFTWMRTNAGIVRLSEGGGMGAGWSTRVTYDSSLTVADYKVLNATLVIDD